MYFAPFKLPAFLGSIYFPAELLYCRCGEVQAMPPVQHMSDEAGEPAVCMEAAKILKDRGGERVFHSNHLKLVIFI
jgi:hypothetical protein